MKNTRARNLTHGALIAALYVVLSTLQNTLLPGSASMAIQYRAAEALCILALFTPSAIWGLSLGCLLFNITSSAALPLDWFIGTTATALAAMAMYQLRQVKVKKLPIFALLMPVLANGLLVGAELTIYIGNSMWFNMLCVAAGELAVMATLGVGLYYALLPVKDRLFGDK